MTVGLPGPQGIGPSGRSALLNRFKLWFSAPRVTARGYAQDNNEISSLLRRGLVRETGRGIPQHPCYRAAAPKVRDH